MKARDETESRVIFISVPESLRGNQYGGLSIDPAIPLPVELLPGETKLNLEELSWEMMLSGMMKVVSAGDGISPDAPFDVSEDDKAYYRGFVLAVRPGIREELSAAALLKVKNGDYVLARDIMKRLQGLFPESPEVALTSALVWEEQAYALERAGTNSRDALKKAHYAYKKLLSFRPPFADGVFNAAFFYLKLRNYEKARECFTNYTAIADNDEQKARAEEIIREINSSGLDDEVFQEAYELINTGKEEEGVERIRGFIERRPGVWHGWFLLGWGLRRQKRWRDGEASFRKAIELGGTNSDTRNELAICLLELGELKDAKKELETALRADPENTKIISNLGILAMKNGNADEAAAFFRTVLEIEPNDRIARDCLSNMTSTQ